MSDKAAKVGLPTGEIPKDEQDLRGHAAIATMVQNIVQRERNSWMHEIAEVLGGLDIPDRSQVPDLGPNRKETASVRCSSPTEPIYRRMSAEEREWRNPDSDHWNAEWLRGHALGDHGRMLHAQAKLEGLFGRADLTEGAAGAAGALSTGTGGPLIPRPLEAVVMIARDRVAKMRRFATIYQMTRQQHTIPTAGAMTAAMAAEGTTAAQGEPTIASVALVAQKGQAKAIATKELLDDAAVNLINVFATRGGGALGVLEDNQFFRLGDGTAPNITKITGTTYNEVSSGELKYTDVLGMYFGVGQQYRDAAVWFVAANVLQLMSNVRDGQGRPIYQGLTDTPGPITDDPTAVGTVMRKRVYEVPFSNGEIWFGDPMAVYAIGQRQGIEVEVSPHVLFETDRIMWKITQRFAGNNVDTVAARYATGITSATSL